MMGYGNGADYFSSLTTELWRLSLGLGYRFSDRLVLKAEYSFERGKEASGDKRQQEDFFGTEAAFKF
jgi:long-subunit fatty acid transport protein